MRILVFSFAISFAVFGQTHGSFQDVQATLKTYCVACHTGKAAAAKIDLTAYASPEKVVEARPTWIRVLNRVKNSEMPPKGSPAPGFDEREKFIGWVDVTLRKAACASGPIPGPSIIHRLNRDEYSATMRDLLNIQVSAGHALPADGAGGEGFDNAAETLFLSPIHAEKYLEAARQALTYAARDPKARATFLTVEPDANTTPEAAARKVLEAFVPRAFRRPATTAEVDRYYALYTTARARKESFEESILYSLQAVLMSPHFLFRREKANVDAGPRLLNDYDLAARLSYFLWGTTPDQILTDLAAQGKLQDPEVLRAQVTRMLTGAKSRQDGDRVRIVPDPKLTEFASRFIEQWLGTRELGRNIKPDQALFPTYYDPDLQAGIRYEPILYFQEVLSTNLSLLTLIDSNFTFINTALNKHYGLKIEKTRQQPEKREVTPESHRGGLLGMAAIAAVSSNPNRTSPVLRGKWILETLLGTPPPPPPPNVPELKEARAGDPPKTLRERLEQHRQNPVCATCHDRIDPMGFGMEPYDVLGRWRTEDAGKPIDAKGELPDGTKFDGPDELKKALLAKKDQFLHHLTSKMLGYALGRGLTLDDSCTVDRIVAEVAKNEYKSHTLIQEIVLSVPFRYQAGTNPRLAVAAATPAAKGE